MLKFKRLACGIEDVTQYNTIHDCYSNGITKHVVGKYIRPGGRSTRSGAYVICVR